MRPAIKIENLQKAYGPTQALKGINLEVNEGELFGLIGPDGAGKTTLFRILTTLVYPDQGEVSVLDKDPVKDYKRLRQVIGYMPGRFSLYQDLSVEENLKLFASIFETTIEENYHLIKDIYQQIEPFRKRKAGQLSGGMKQKLALSCAMIHKPQVLFLDEPTTGVDPVSRREFWDMLDKLHEAGITILVSTPYMDEAKRCERIGLIQNGELLGTDTPDNIIEKFSLPLYAVKGPNKYAILKGLRSHPASHSVYSFGSEVHFSSTSIKEKEILAHLADQHIEVSDVHKITPGIEDTFMELMSHEMTKND
jgi:ABC-2 type transport system ATP-binding protein